jgi:hypothetical protein
MDSWVKNTVMLAVTGVWVVVVLTSLIRGTLPDPVTWGIPGGVYYALNPTLPGRKKEPVPTTEAASG